MLPCSKYNRPGSPLCGKIFMTRPVVRRWIAEAHPARTGQACGGGGAPGSSARDTRSRELYGNCGNWENCVITHCFNKIIPPHPSFSLFLILLLLLFASSFISDLFFSFSCPRLAPLQFLLLFILLLLHPIFSYSYSSSPLYPLLTSLSVRPSVGWSVVGLSVIISCPS